MMALLSISCFSLMDVLVFSLSVSVVVVGYGGRGVCATPGTVGMVGGGGGDGGLSMPSSMPSSLPSSDDSSHHRVNHRYRDYQPGEYVRIDESPRASASALAEPAPLVAQIIMHSDHGGVGGDHNNGNSSNNNNNNNNNGIFNFAILPIKGSIQRNGYFYVDVQLGTPERTFSLIVDTGSSTTYVPCKECASECGDHKLHTPYNPATSSTFRGVSCGSLECATGICSTDVLSSDESSFLGTSACLYTRHYAEHSSSTGQLVSDLIHIPLFDGEMMNNASSSSAPTSSSSSVSRRVVFGCELRETGYIYEQTADGVLGLGRSKDAIVPQLTATSLPIDSTLTSASFALCIADTRDNNSETAAGSLIMGTPPLPRAMRDKVKHVSLTLDPRHPTHHIVALKGVRVGNTTLPTTTKSSEIVRSTVGSLAKAVQAAFSGDLSFSAALKHEEELGDLPFGRLLAVVDSGTTWLYLPSAGALYQRFVTLVDAHVTARGGVRIAAADGGGDVCWVHVPGGGGGKEEGSGGGDGDAAGALNKLFPSAALVFEDGVELQLPPEHMLFAHRIVPGAFCLGVFESGGQSAVVGAAALRDVLVTFDVERARLGILQDNRHFACAKVADMIGDYARALKKTLL